VRRRKVWPVGGVMWCPVHNGLADEISDKPDHCDMSGGSVALCDLRPMYFGRAGK
jgi:hypothetical protein